MTTTQKRAGAKERRAGRKALAQLLATSLIIAAWGPAPQAFAQEVTARQSFDIPAQPLSAALQTFSRQTGWNLSYAPALVRGQTSGAASGVMSAEAALSRLVAPSGLRIVVNAPGSAALLALAPSEDGAVTLRTVRLSGGNLGRPDDAFETAGSVGYVTGEEIVQNRGTSVGDFLNGIPGVLNGDNRNSGALDVNIRGMQGQGRVPVVIDGASQEQTVYRGYNGARSGSYVDPDFIGEVAIEKGASSGADASGAIGGIVRMNTLSVNDILLPGRKFGIRIRGGFNSNSTGAPPVLTSGGVVGGMFQNGRPINVRDGGNMDRPSLLSPTGGNGSVALAYSTDAFDLVAAVARRRNGNYFSGENGKGQAHLVDLGDNGYGWTVVGYEGLSPWKGGEEILNTSTDNRSVLLKGNFRLGTDHAIELGYMRYESAFGEIMPSRLGTHTSAVGGFQSELDHLDLKTFTGRYRWSPDSDLINLKVDVFRTDMDHRATNLLTMYGITTESYSWSQAIRTGVTISNESLISAVPGEFRLTYGGAWQRESIGLPKDLHDRDWVIDHLEFAPRTGHRVETSGFVNADWQINPEWQVMAGLRYADYRTTDHNYWLRTGGFWPNFTYQLFKGETTQTSGHGLSKNIALSWTPSADLQLYARYSDAMRMPSIFETIKGFSTGYLPADLRPERARNFEAGVNKSFVGLFGTEDRTRVHFAYYDNNIDDYLTRSNVRYPYPIGFQDGGLGMINLKNARMKGIELSGDYAHQGFSARLSWNHAITSRFCAYPGTLYRQDALCSEGGFLNSYALQHVPPKDTVSLQLGYVTLEDKLSVGTKISHYSNRFVQSIVPSTSEIQPGKWKPYTLVDVFASYKFSEAHQLDFAIDNLTDRYYMDALNAALVPAPGRTMRMNFTARF